MSGAHGVSVVMTTYNGSRYVREQLASIVAQTVKPLEIVIGDDGSSDGTVEIIEEFASSTDVPVHVTVNPQRLGFADNFLHTSRRAKGDLIALSDQDDVWLPGKLAAATDGLSKPAHTMWIGGWRIVDENLGPIPRDRRFHTGFVQRSALAYPMHVPHGARAVFRRELLDYFPADGRARSVFGDRPAHHDEWIMFAASVLGRVVSTSTPTMMYRRHAEAVGAEFHVPSRRELLDMVAEAFDDNVLAAARDRGRYLEQRAMAPECEPVRRQMERGADYYRSLVPKLVRRTTTQTAVLRRERASSLLRSAVRGDYLPLAKGGLGLWILLQDGYALTR